MSRGLGKLQREIDDVLHARRPLLAYAATSGGLTTGELVNELVAGGVLADGLAHEFQLATVRRACAGLVRRGLVVGARDKDELGRWTTTWKRADPGANLPQGSK